MDFHSRDKIKYLQEFLMTTTSIILQNLMDRCNLSFSITFIRIEFVLLALQAKNNYFTEAEFNC